MVLREEFENEMKAKMDGLELLSVEAQKTDRINNQLRFDMNNIITINKKLKDSNHKLKLGIKEGEK